MDKNWVAVILIGVVSFGLIINGFISAVTYGGLLLSPPVSSGNGVIWLGAVSLISVFIIGLIFQRDSKRKRR